MLDQLVDPHPPTPTRAHLANVEERARRLHRRRRAGRGAGALLAVALVAAGIVVTNVEPSDDRTVDTGQGFLAGGVPVKPMVDVAPDHVLFHGVGTPEVVAQAYLDDREVLAQVRGEPIERGDYLEVRWESCCADDSRGEGIVALRPAGDGWDVLLAVSSMVDVSNLARTDTRLGGTIGGDDAGMLTLRVATLDGEVLTSTDDGLPIGRERIYPTSGRPGTGPWSVDLALPEEPVTVRVQLVGGSYLSLTEFVLDPPTWSGDAAGDSSTDAATGTTSVQQYRARTVVLVAGAAGRPDLTENAVCALRDLGFEQIPTVEVDDRPNISSLHGAAEGLDEAQDAARELFLPVDPTSTEQLALLDEHDAEVLLVVASDWGVQPGCDSR